MKKQITKSEIKEILLKNGFTVRPQPDGKKDLNPYVYTAVSELLKEFGIGVTPDICMSIIVAKDLVSNYIGDNGKLPWHISHDLKRFKELTRNKVVIMGRKTCESLGFKPLPFRTNIVVTRDPAFNPVGFVTFGTLDAAILYAESVAAATKMYEFFIVGGGEIYAQTINRADKLYITEVNAEFIGETKFPDIDHHVWQKEHHEKGPEDLSGLRYWYDIYSRR